MEEKPLPPEEELPPIDTTYCNCERLASTVLFHPLPTLLVHSILAIPRLSSFRTTFVIRVSKYPEEKYLSLSNRTR